MKSFCPAVCGGRCSNFLDESAGRALESNVDIVEARITWSGDGDFSFDLIQRCILRYECIFLIV